MIAFGEGCRRRGFSYCAGPTLRALFDMPSGPYTDPDDALFKRQPKSVRALNLVARREARAKARYAWAMANPNNPKVAGKALTKP